MIGDYTEAGQAQSSQNKEEWQSNDEPCLIVLENSNFESAIFKIHLRLCHSRIYSTRLHNIPDPLHMWNIQY